MKKVIAIFSSLAMALVVSLVMVGCTSGDGGGTAAVADKKSDFVWFKVEVPDGVSISNAAGDTCDKAGFKFEDGKRIIIFYEDGETAQQFFDKKGQDTADAFEWTVADPETHGGKKWLVATYNHSGGNAKYYCTDVNGGIVYIDVMSIEGHEDLVNKMLDTIEFPDDVKQAVKDAKQKNLTDVEIKK